MTDVQVSNARRIGFTAAAVVAFWVLALRMYSTVCSFIDPPTLHRWVPFLDAAEALGDYRVTMGVVLGLAPGVLLAASECDSPRRLFRARWIMVAGVLFMCCLVWSVWIAELDTYEASGGDPMLHPRHRAFHPWLHLPLILTTAFVIYGAWRRAVRDAEVEDEDE